MIIQKLTIKLNEGKHLTNARACCGTLSCLRDLAASRLGALGTSSWGQGGECQWCLAGGWHFVTKPPPGLSCTGLSAFLDLREAAPNVRVERGKTQP